MTRRVEQFGYVYGGTALIKGKPHELEGTAWSLGRCDEVRLRAAAVRELTQSQNVPLEGIEITDFWFSEIFTESEVRQSTESADPFRPHAGPDPFRPCGGDI